MRFDIRAAPFRILEQGFSDMKQGPLFRRQFFIQKPAPGAPESGGDVHYLRLHGHAANPAQVLSEQRIFLGPGGMLDVVSESHGGAGIGRVAYTPGLRAAIKRHEEQITYRFEVPSATATGTTFQVTAYGHDRVPSFHFIIEVGRRA
jgi:hypothetical protein